MSTRFEDVYALLRARGLIQSQVRLDGLKSSDKAAIVAAFSALLNQLDEEAELRSSLLARNQALESQIDRMRRTHKQDDGRIAGIETKLNQASAKLQNASAALASEQAAHRATSEQLTRAQRVAQQTKVAALQHKAATERTTERMRERLAQISMSNIKSLLPDIRIASTSFDGQAGSQHASMAEQQLADLEKRHLTLMEASQATKQLVVDAINGMRLADFHLDPANRASDDVPAALEQRDVFPPMQPLALSDTPATHPAKHHMQLAIEALEDRVDSLSTSLAKARAGLEEEEEQEQAPVTHTSGKAQRVRVRVRAPLRQLNTSDNKRRRM
ncbi:hypothetical protein MCUN1_001913 [Malassezia cuniculi]|uniref:Uncharacterized protein n=1 Tax=Malassezia cuniculi TaxID=948313 RepID=A0AAF0ERB6_9BASI|nr:hypothetical protein MCUN1_001913 [Malassezia cuniculi]